MAHTNKGSYGKLLIIAGSVNMSGAACFCAKAAYRMGSGLVRVFTCEQNRLILQTKVPEAVLVTGQENEEETLLAEQLQWADAVVFGPGIGTGQRARRMTCTVLAQCRVPLVLDADALNIIADQPELLEQAKTDIILTPHPGEMSRLTTKPVSEILTTLEQSAETFAKRFHVICVLKDFHTVTAVSDGMTYVNLSGNNGMATAGSGDVLAGVIGSLLAQGMKAEEAAPLGVYVHGLAGDAAKEKCGVRGMMASDIIEGLKEVENHEKNRVYAGIDLDALRYNMESMHKNIKEGTKIAAVIKADAYGHGALTVAKTIEDLPYVWGFAVATADEAEMLIADGRKKPILILGISFPEHYELIVEKKYVLQSVNMRRQKLFRISLSEK